MYFYLHSYEMVVLQILTGAYIKFLRNTHSFMGCKVKLFGGSQSQVGMFSFAAQFTCHCLRSCAFFPDILNMFLFGAHSLSLQ